MATQTGRQSITFENPPWIISNGCVAGTKEAEGPIGHEIDLVGENDNFGCDIWEEAESTLQKEALTIALGKAGLKAEDLRYLFAGDLLGQSMATSFGLQQFDIPLFGLYGACSTAGESLALAAMTVAAGYADLAGAVTSSHFASAEKQFRFPLEYANQRPYVLPGRLPDPEPLYLAETELGQKTECQLEVGRENVTKHGKQENAWIQKNCHEVK